MRRIDEALQSFGDPMITSSLPELAVHPLLDDHPPPIVRDNKTVQIEIEAVLHRAAVDLGNQSAGGR
jgi:hypothetical protein